MTIRAYKPEDLPEVRRLFAQVLELHVENRPDFFRYGGEFNVHSDAMFLVAELDGDIVAFSNADIIEPSENPILVPRKTLRINEFCVDLARRRRGIGRELMLANIAAARERGAVAVELNTWTFNSGAVAFYESIGMTARCLTMELPL